MRMINKMLLFKFYDEYISLIKKSMGKRPKQEDILFFLTSNKIVESKYNLNYLALFVWEFWNVKRRRPSELDVLRFCDYYVSKARI